MPDEFHPNSTDAVLARIETKLDTVISTQDDLKKRVTSLERWKWGLMGGAAVVAFAFRTAWEWVTGGPKH